MLWVMEDIDGDPFRPCREHHFPRVSPVLLARSILSGNHCRISSIGRTLDLTHVCVLKSDIQDKHFYVDPW